MTKKKSCSSPSFVSKEYAKEVASGREEIVLTNAETILSSADHAELVTAIARLDEKARRAGLAERIDAAEKLLTA
jgi:hypothetical protein